MSQQIMQNSAKREAHLEYFAENVVSKAMLRSFLSRDMASETKHGILVSVDSMLLQC